MSSTTVGLYARSEKGEVSHGCLPQLGHTNSCTHRVYWEHLKNEGASFFEEKKFPSGDDLPRYKTGKIPILTAASPDTPSCSGPGAPPPGLTTWVSSDGRRRRGPGGSCRGGGRGRRGGARSWTKRNFSKKSFKKPTYISWTGNVCFLVFLKCKVFLNRKMKDMYIVFFIFLLIFFEKLCFTMLKKEMRAWMHLNMGDMREVKLLGRGVQILFSRRGIKKICSGRGRNCFL